MGKGKALTFLAGVLAGIVLVVAVGFTNLGTVTATMTKVRYLISGKEIRPSDQPQQYFNGKVYVPASLNYGGTTYLPLRFVAEALGLQVDWNGETQTISINELPSDTKPVYPQDLPVKSLTKADAPQEVTALLDCSIGTELAQSYTLGDKTYLIVTRGSRPTGGYGVDIKQVVETETEVIVKVEYRDPAPDAEVTQAITYPYVVGMIEKTTKPIRFEGADGIYISELYGLEHMESITAESKAIKLFTPVKGEDGLTVRGIARVFEATVSWRLTDSQGQEKDKGCVTAASGGPNWGYFSFEVPAQYQKAGINLYVYEESAKDGQPVNVVQIPVDKYAKLAS
ncbi:MAG: Gmad2 immunoglobulin-like domain-containing protein [bacterium]